MRTRLASVLAIGILLLSASAVTAADTDIVINEIMQNPSVLSDTVGEWFEIVNTGVDPVDIEGWTLKDDGSDSHVIASGGPLVIPAGGYAVLARDAATMALEGVTALYQYSGFLLSNSADEVVLLNASLVEIDRVNYDGGPLFPDPNGASMMCLVEDAVANDSGANWTASATPFGSGDSGTPGASNGGAPLLPPTVTDVYHRSLLPEPAEAVTVYADADDADGTVTDVTLYYVVNGGGANAVTMTLSAGITYTATIPGMVDGDVVDYFVEATDDDGQFGSNPATGTYSYTVAPETITPIASVHADSLGYAGSVIMVQGQVYIPGDYKADGTSVSAYIQGASGRGLNVFGTTRSTGGTLLNDTSALVKVTGTAVWYGTTVELLNYEVELVSSGNPALTPAAQASTLDAAAPTNEGTYVQATGPITAISTTAGDNPAHNFTIDDGSGPVVIRIDDDTVPTMTGWIVGDELVAAGAGSTYAGQGQILVGLATDVVNNGQGPDVTPPTLVSAAFTEADTVTVVFSEAVDPVTAQVAGNYAVAETGSGTPVTVLSATQQTDPAVVVLIVASSLTGTPHTLTVDLVEDVAGNPIAPGSSITITVPGPLASLVINEIMQNPNVILDGEGEWFEIYNAGADPVDINGWTISDFDTDSHVIANGGPLVINAGEYMVLGIDAAAMGLQGVTLAYQYTGITLANGGDELVLTDLEGRMVDTVAWDGGPIFPDPVGASMQWTGIGDNDDGATWGSEGGPVFGGGDRGTPGAANDLTTPVPSLLTTALGANHPNPFNPVTAFSFSLEREAKVNLGVYDTRGRLVRTVVNAVLPAGDHVGSYRWDGRDESGRSVTSGTYFYRLTTDDGFAASRKMTLLK